VLASPWFLQISDKIYVFGQTTACNGYFCQDLWFFNGQMTRTKRSHKPSREKLLFAKKI